MKVECGNRGSGRVGRVGWGWWGGLRVLQDLESNGNVCVGRVEGGEGPLSRNGAKGAKLPRSVEAVELRGVVCNARVARGVRAVGADVERVICRVRLAICAKGGLPKDVRDMADGGLEAGKVVARPQEASKCIADLIVAGRLKEAGVGRA